MLDFQPLTLDMKGMIDGYTFKYGENSCQHSFVSSFCLYNKYGDMFCESGNFLFTLRSKLCNDKERVYLFPHGDFEDFDGIKNALQKICEDAHEKNCKVKFNTLTERAKNIVIKLFPGKFLIEGSRDYSEYVYKVEKLIKLPGGELARKRQYVNKFFRFYGGRCRSEKITPEYFSDILKFQSEWLENKNSIDKNPSHQAFLEIENEEIHTAFKNFDELGLSGIVLLIDGAVKGYFFGCPLSDNCFTDIVNKADRNINGIYHVMVGEFLKKCCSGYGFINRQEDLGVQGLRKIKTEYKPDFMIYKFVLTEAAE